jgi:hypothetical protein
MNPSLRFAQIVRGKPDARPAGIIDTAAVARLVDAVELLSASASFSATDRQGMTEWFRAYLDWLRTTDQGIHEGQARNNHGAWYDVQVVSLALAVGEVEAAREVLQFARKRRIGRAVEPDGSLPAELARTRSWHYAVYHLTALVALADLGDAAGIDLWHYQTPDGRAIRKAIDWLVPFALGQKRWTTPEIGGFAPRELVPCLHEGAARLPAPELTAAAQRIGSPPDDRSALFVSP